MGKALMFLTRSEFTEWDMVARRQDRGGSPETWVTACFFPLHTLLTSHTSTNGVKQRTFLLLLSWNLQVGKGACRTGLLQWLLQGTVLLCLLRFLVAPCIPSGFPVACAVPSSYMPSCLYFCFPLPPPYKDTLAF